MNFEETELHSDRLILKRTNPQLHAKEINAVVCDSIETLSPWLPWAKEKPTVEETRKGLERVCADSHHYSFRLYLKPNMDLIGMTGIMLMENENKYGSSSYEIGYWIHKNYVRKGYISEAVSCVMTFAVDCLHADLFEIVCYEKNIASQKVAAKLGFSMFSTRRDSSSLRPEWGEYAVVIYQKHVKLSGSDTF